MIQSALLWFLGTVFLLLAPMITQAGTSKPARPVMYALIVIGVLCVRFA